MFPCVFSLTYYILRARFDKMQDANYHSQGIIHTDMPLAKSMPILGGKSHAKRRKQMSCQTSGCIFIRVYYTELGIADFFKTM
jgi:hypothetical protein